MNRLKKKYQDEIAPQLMKEFGYNSSFQVSRIKKIVVNMGVTEPADPRARKKLMPNIVEQFRIITGQQPQVTLAKKSIANFKLREGDPMGVMVTLRGQLMWEFLDKLISTTLPRVKDFRGVSKKSFDGHGNYSLGMEEQIAFPEISYDSIDTIRGLQINIVTTNKSNEETLKLLELMGMPFEKEN